MIQIRSSDLEEALLNAQLIQIELDDDGFCLRFDNGRCLTGNLKINVGECSIVPKLELMAGYNSDHLVLNPKDRETF